MKRTFIAIDVYPEPRLLAAVKKIKDYFAGEVIKWVHLEPGHITLSFIGNTTEEQVAGVIDLLDKRLEDFGPFPVRISGVGFFGRPGNPKVIYAGVDSTVELLHLQKLTLSVVKEVGLTADTKPFRPHLTLGRIKHFSGDRPLSGLGVEISEGILQEQTEDKVVFYESILTPAGPVYKPLWKKRTTID
jgi:RNA 2',3'-cyclic 3'-phosphodiesterase